MSNIDFDINDFDLTIADIDRLINYIRGFDEPVTSLDLAKKVVRGRIRHGIENSPKALESWTKKRRIKLWDPTGDWEIGEDVIVIAMDPGNDYEHNAFIGKVCELDGEKNRVKVCLEIGDIQYNKAEPGSDDAINWRNKVREIVTQKEKSAEIDDQVIGVIAQYGDRIVSRVNEVLEQDERFIGLDNYWYLTYSVNRLNSKQLQSIYKELLNSGMPATIQELRLICEPAVEEGKIGEFRLFRSMKENGDRFECIIQNGEITWNAILPESDQIVIGKHAYDPDTFEILCNPGSRVTNKAKERLQELGLLTHVIELDNEF